MQGDEEGASYDANRKEKTMSEEHRASSGGGVAMILVGAVLVVGGGLLLANLGAFIDSVSFYVNVPVLVAVLVVVGLVAVFLWIQGHRVWAQAKGYSSLLGLVLGFLVVVGFVILLCLPSRGKKAAVEPAVGEAGAEGDVSADEGQGN